MQALCIWSLQKQVCSGNIEKSHALKREHVCAVLEEAAQVLREQSSAMPGVPLPHLFF